MFSGLDFFVGLLMDFRLCAGFVGDCIYVSLFLCSEGLLDCPGTKSSPFGAGIVTFVWLEDCLW